MILGWGAGTPPESFGAPNRESCLTGSPGLGQMGAGEPCQRRVPHARRFSVPARGAIPPGSMRR
jgi:hypothetical protein